MTSSVLSRSDIYADRRFDVKTGGESIYAIDTPVDGTCVASNRLYVKKSSISSIVPIVFPSVFALKAPCTYTVDVMLSVQSDNGNALAFYATYKIGQLEAGGPLIYSAPSPLLNSSTTVTVGDLVTITKNPDSDTVDFALNPTNGGIMTACLGVQVFNNSDF